ncbi:hypothetical protein Daus18300_004358 [Diaporthe australafricana]|uniref:Uncharacterized protein n=1 Tax=Diaporthe australafricana TaxID=127596 RepID=A0ABR3X8V0_9PEZI
MDLPENPSTQSKTAPASGSSASAKPSLVEPPKSKQATTSQQLANKPRPTTTRAGEGVSEAKDPRGIYSKLSSRDGWDGVMIDETPFPLSEIGDLIALQSTDHFYGYARVNGRVGIIMDNLMDARLRAMAINVTAQLKAEIEQIEAKAARNKSKGKGKARAQTRTRTRATAQHDAATGSGQATEFGIPSQTFELICEDLMAHVENIDSSNYTEADKQLNKVCVDAIKAVSQRAKDLSKQTLISKPAAASTSPATDSKTRCSAHRPFPRHREPCGRRLPCLEHSTRSYSENKPLFGMPLVDLSKKADVPELREDELLEATKDLGAAAPKAACEQANKGGEAPLTYSQAAKAAARYYATTSAYGRPLEKSAEGDGNAVASGKAFAPDDLPSQGERT